MYGLLRESNSQQFSNGVSSAILSVKKSVDSIYNDLNNLNNPQDIFEKTKHMFKNFVTEFDSAKKNILGVKTVGERDPRVRRSKKLSKILSEIDSIYESLNKPKTLYEHYESLKFDNALEC